MRPGAMKRHIWHIVIVSLKYFFDIDYSLCLHTFSTLIIGVGITKLFVSQAQYIFSNGLLTVKQDILTLRDQLNAYKERWSM